MDGVAVHERNLEDGVAHGSSNFGSYDERGFGSVFTSFTRQNFGISMEKEWVAYPDWNNDPVRFINFFAVGTSSFDAGPAGGFTFYVVGSNGNTFTTSNGPQNGSSIRIVEIEDNSSLLFGGSAKVLIEFNCTVYDGEGNSMEITEGEYLGEFMEL